MFETSFLLLLKTLAFNVFLPLIPGIIFLRIFFGKKIQWTLLYLLGRFVWVGVVAFSLFNLQFIHFGIGVWEYFLILWLLLAIFILKILIRKIAIKDYLMTLKIKNIFPEMRHSFFQLSKIEKVFTLICWIFGIVFLVTTFIHTTSFPTYADDSFGNWNGPAINIYHNGGMKMFWNRREILWKGSSSYPVYIPVYKVITSHFAMGINDIYINIWQWLVFFGLLIFIFKITFDKTKNIFYSILPVGLVCALPLIYFHAIEWYMELACATYSVLTIWAFWKFLEERDYDFITLALLLGFILSNIKNDGLLWYFAWIVISFVAILLLSKQFKDFLLWFMKNKSALYTSFFYFVFFLLPFLIVRSINKLWFNPVAPTWWVWISQTVHREIFSVFPSIFMKMDNYNVILIIFFLLVWYLYSQKKNFNKYFLLLSWFAILIIFILVFLLTENYLRVMNQTTVNRVFTMSFVILLSFSGILLYNHRDE